MPGPGRPPGDGPLRLTAPPRTGRAAWGPRPTGARAAGREERPVPGRRTLPARRPQGIRDVPEPCPGARPRGRPTQDPLQPLPLLTTRSRRVPAHDATGHHEGPARYPRHFREPPAHHPPAHPTTSTTGTQTDTTGWHTQPPARTSPQDTPRPPPATPTRTRPPPHKTPRRHQPGTPQKPPQNTILLNSSHTSKSCRRSGVLTVSPAPLTGIGFEDRDHRLGGTSSCMSRYFLQRRTENLRNHADTSVSGRVAVQ